MSTPDDRRAVEVDARGLRCPAPVIALARAAQHADDGTELVVLATDPAAEPDVAAWCRMRGHDLLGQAWDGDVIASRVRVRSGAVRRSGAAAAP